MGGKSTSCWISSTATEQGDLGAACTAGWHPALPMTGWPCSPSPGTVTSTLPAWGSPSSSRSAYSYCIRSPRPPSSPASCSTSSAGPAAQLPLQRRSLLLPYRAGILSGSHHDLCNPGNLTQDAMAGRRQQAGFEPDLRCTSAALRIYLRFVERGLVREAACRLSLAGHRRLPAPGRPARASPCPILKRQAKITRRRG